MRLLLDTHIVIWPQQGRLKRIGRAVLPGPQRRPDHLTADRRFKLYDVPIVLSGP